MGSPSLVFNGLGGTSTSEMATAAVARASALAAASSNPSQQDFYDSFARDQTKLELSLIERKDDPVTDSGLLASLKFFDGYNHQGGRKQINYGLSPNVVGWSPKIQNIICLFLFLTGWCERAYCCGEGV